MKKKNVGIRRFALKLLRKYGCDRDAYKGESIKFAFESLNDENVDCGKYGKMNVAKELVRIGNEVKDKNDKYRLIWDSGDTVDGYDVGNNKKHLKQAMEECYADWMVNFTGTADDWDWMIEECHCSCYQNKDLGPNPELCEIWGMYLTDNELKKIGWVRTDEMTDDVYEIYQKSFGWSRRVKK